MRNARRAPLLALLLTAVTIAPAAVRRRGRHGPRLRALPLPAPLREHRPRRDAGLPAARGLPGPRASPHERRALRVSLPEPVPGSVRHGFSGARRPRLAA